MELKNGRQELCEAHTSINNKISQEEQRVSEMEDYLGEIRQADKIREKRIEKNEQYLQEIWYCVKRPNLQLIEIPERDGKNGNKVENTF